MGKSTYIFDFDSTLVTLESLDELARIATSNLEDKDERMIKLEEITNLGMLGQIDFRDSLDRRLALFSPTNEDIKKVVRLLSSSISPSVWANRQWFENNSNRIYVISGGFEECILPITRVIGLKDSHVYANRFLFDKKGKFIGYDPNRLTSKRAGKVEQTKKLHLPKPIVIIGDGYTDYEIKLEGEADMFYAFTETVIRPEVVYLADKEIKSFRSLD